MADTPSISKGRVLFSHRLGAHRLAGRDTIPLGLAHYSHALVGHRILGALAYLGSETHELIGPEIYAAPEALRSIKGFRPGDIHLIFKPIEEIRILRSAYNIACVVWEFDQINERAPPGHPCSHHTRMLNTADEIWCYCTFTRDVLRKYLSDVHLIPVPFAAPGRADRGSAPPQLPRALSGVPARRSASQRVHRLGALLNEIPAAEFVALSILNPVDLRKNAENLLRAFALFQMDKPGAILVLKLIVDNNVRRLDNLDRYFKIGDAGDNIFVITEELSTESLAGLYQFSDFYICASHCEGLGMPLIEAMGHGVIPIAVNHTAMADYINDQNAFVIPSILQPAAVASNSASNSNLTWYASDITSIAQALERAYRSSPQTRHNMRIAATETVRTNYSLEASASRVGARLNAARARAGA